MAVLNKSKPDPSKSLVFGRGALYQGVNYERGDAVPDQKAISKATVEKMFRSGVFANGDAPAKEPVKEVEVEKKEEVKEEAPKQTQTTRSKRRTKKDTE